MYDVEIKAGGMLSKDITIRAKEIDDSNPFFVVIKGIEKPIHSTLLHTPNDEVFEKFAQYEYVKFPQHQIGFFGKLKKDNNNVLSIANEEQEMDH